MDNKCYRHLFINQKTSYNVQSDNYKGG